MTERVGRWPIDSKMRRVFATESAGSTFDRGISRTFESLSIISIREKMSLPIADALFSLFRDFGVAMFYIN